MRYPYIDFESNADLLKQTLSLVPETILSPVQIQKLFFLLDKRLNLHYFEFHPHHYGPYSLELTKTLEQMVTNSEIDIYKSNGINYFKINQEHIIDPTLDVVVEHTEFIKNLVRFVKQLSFRQLCMAIYKEFPDMAKNSVLFTKK